MGQTLQEFTKLPTFAPSQLAWATDPPKWQWQQYTALPNLLFECHAEH